MSHYKAGHHKDIDSKMNKTVLIIILSSKSPSKSNDSLYSL